MLNINESWVEQSVFDQLPIQQEINAIHDEMIAFIDKNSEILSQSKLKTKIYLMYLRYGHYIKPYHQCFASTTCPAHVEKPVPTMSIQNPPNVDLISIIKNETQAVPKRIAMFKAALRQNICIMKD